MNTKYKGILLLSSIILLIISTNCTALVSPASSHVKNQSSFPALSAKSRTACAPTKDDGDEGDGFEYDEYGRPILSGEEVILDTEHFRIHYTLSGRDAAASTDFIDEIALALEYSWDVEINQFGWKAPPPDNGIGGDDRYDVYIQGIYETEYGHVDIASTTCGIDPFTRHGEASFMVLDSQFTHIGSDVIDNPLETMRGTVAHELNHSIQYAYDSNEPYGFLWEATATWMEDEVYDDFNSSDEYSTAVFYSPDTCQLAEGGSDRVEDESHWYGEWLYLRYLSELYGHETIRSIWEYTLEFDNYDAIAAALSDENTSLEETFQGFSIALLTRNFEEGERYPTVRLEGSAIANTPFTPDDGVGQMAADYVEILDPEHGIIEVQLNADTLQGVLVGIKDLEATIYDMPSNQLAVDIGSFDHLYLVVLNLNQAFREYRCENTSYSVTVQSASQVSSDLSTKTISVPNFQLPNVIALENPDEYWDEDYEKPFKAPAELFPYYLPSGYEFSDAWETTAEEYEQEYDIEAIWVIPGGGLATVIDFWGPCDDFYISIVISESPYENMDGWYDETGYPPYPEETYTISGVETVFYDYTADIGPFFSVNFIYMGNFYTIDGTIAMDEMTKVVESMFE